MLNDTELRALLDEARLAATDMSHAHSETRFRLVDACLELHMRTATAEAAVEALRSAVIGNKDDFAAHLGRLVAKPQL